MKKLFVLAACAAALATSACVTVIDAGDHDGANWSGQNAQPFDASLDACKGYAGRDQSTAAFAACMAEKGWSRDDD